MFLLSAAFSSPLTAQAEFKRQLQIAKQTVQKLDETTESERPSLIAAALLALRDASSAVANLPEHHQAQARFAIEVWRAMIHLRGGPAGVAKVIAVGRAARAAARQAGAYESTFYRSLLLLVMRHAMADVEFFAFLDEAGDREYLLDPKRVQELAGPREWQQEARELRYLQSDMLLDAQPQRAIEELRKLAADSPRLQDRCVSRLVWHHIELRDYERAQFFLEQLSDSDTRYPRALIAYKQGDHEYAAEQMRASFEADKSVPPPAKHLLLSGNAIEGQARDARFQGRGERATELYRIALVNFQKARVQAKEPYLIAAACNGAGDCHLGLRDLAAAQNAYAKALRSLQGSQSWTARAERAETLKDQARLAELRSEPTNAIRLYREALDSVEKIREEIPFDRLGIAWLESGQMEAVDGLLRASCRGEVSPLSALANVDRMKARGLLDWMSSPPSDSGLEGFRRVLRDLSRARKSDDIARHRAALEAIRAGGPGHRQQAAPLTEARLASLLSDYPDSTFLSYWSGKSAESERRVFVVMARGATTQVLDLGSTSDGDLHYAAARRAVQSPEENATSALDAAAAFFVPPAVRGFTASAKSLVLCLDADLAGLPFEAFSVDGHALGVRYPIYRTPSLAVFARLAARAAKEGGALIVDSAKPPAVERRLHDLSPLTESRREGDLVAKSHPSHVRLREADAVFAKLRSQLVPDAKLGLLHISCHAVNHTRIPSASLLMLSDAPLDMSSLATLHLRGMLVVFSACSSAGSSRAGGEGVKGLLWGPLSAGARAVVASHWHMNQQATKDLMGQFHFHLAAGAPVGEAMRRAREALAGAANYAHPTYWAGFGVYGVPPRASSQSFTPLSITLSGLCLLVLLGFGYRFGGRRSANR